MPQRILVPLIVACALFMENLDSTILSTALPTIAEDFGTSPIDLKLALTSYLLAIAIFIPASGWLADRFGARLIFCAAISVFTLGSILCGLSQSMTMLVFARIVQGIGGAMMVPVGRLVILRTVTKQELVGSLAWLTVPALIGPMIGPPVGGFIATNFDWPWIFWINVPVGILGLVLAILFIPDVRDDRRSAFDAWGLLLVVVGLTAFMAGSTTLGLGLIPLPVVLALIVSGAAVLYAYVRYSRHRTDPILDLTLLRLPVFRQSVIGASLFRIGLGATPFLLPLLLQVGFGMTPLESGMVTFSASVGAIILKFAAPRILRRYGFRNVLLVNSVLASAFMLLPAFFTPATPALLMTTLLLIGGFFRSLHFTSLNALTFAEIEPERMSRATTLTSVLQQLTLSLGISVGAVVLELSVTFHGGTMEWTSFWPSFVAVGLISLLAIIPVMQLPPDAGDEVSGHKRALPDPVTTMRERG